jgi:hypothetical protein
LGRRTQYRRIGRLELSKESEQERPQKKQCQKIEALARVLTITYQVQCCCNLEQRCRCDPSVVRRHVEVVVERNVERSCVLVVSARTRPREVDPAVVD